MKVMITSPLFIKEELHRLSMILIVENANSLIINKLMRNLILIVVTTFISLVAFGQKTLTQEQWNKLPADLKAEFELENKVGEASRAVGIGHEIGVAVNETLIAIEDSALRISESDLGKEAIFIAKWKLLYKDFLQIFMGLVFLAFGSTVVFKFFRTSREIIDDDDRADGYSIAAAVSSIVTIAVVAITMFA